MSWRCGATSAGAAATAAEGDATALWPIGRCQPRHRRPKKPTWWQVQPHPGLRPLLCLFFVFVFFFHLNAFFLFFKDKYPHHSLPPHQPCHLLPSFTCTHAVTSMSSPSTLKPFVLILFSIKRRKLLTKALYVSLPCPPHDHFSPSCSASRLLGKAWRLACPSFFPVVNGKGKNNEKDLMRGFLNTIKIDMNFLWLILFFNVML